LASPSGQKDGNKIWISAGSYDGDPGINGFELAYGVSLYGAFPTTGQPNTEAGRNVVTNKTILSDATDGGKGNLLYNDLTNNVTIDGITFTIENEGGMLTFRNASFLTISNCIFNGSTMIYSIFDFSNSNIVTMNKVTGCTTVSVPGTNNYSDIAAIYP
jgi:hypothetical protein